MSTEEFDESSPGHTATAASSSSSSSSSASSTSSSSSSEDEISINVKPAAIAKPKTSKASAYDKKWLENLNLLKPCIKEGGMMDYSSIDQNSRKYIQSFVKDQRKCYRKRENNEPSSMTDERFRLLSEAKFDFKPSETNKANSDKKKEEKKKAKALAQQQTIDQCWGSTPKNTENLTSDSEVTSSGSITLAGKTPVRASGSKTPASKSPTTASKKSPSNGSIARKKSGKPTYLEMVHEAIVSLKDRTGSSVPAISKWVLAKNDKHVKSASSNMFKNRISTAIKQGMKEGRFVKVKSSYKINAEFTKKQKAAARSKEAAKRKAEKQRQKDLDKAKQQRQKELDRVKQQKLAEAFKKKADIEKKKTNDEKKRKEKELTAEQKAEAAQKQAEAAQIKKRKEEAEARRKYIDQQLRKRRCPIEDTKLHREDKEWGVKTPKHVSKRPTLPYTLACLIPPHLRTDSPQKYGASVLNASASGNGGLLDGNNDRGLVTDAIQVYHFFCGDVGIDDADYPVPKFSLKTLLYALDEVLNGNAKEAKSLPPLLTHLFVTALRMLTAPEEVEGEDLGPGELRLQKDLSKLREGLNTISWSQICCFYMDLMERYYTSDASFEDGVLPGEGRGVLDMRYFWNSDKMEEDEPDIDPLKDTDDLYNAYLGNPQGVLMKGYSKLLSQAEPWTLKADELITILRTLTDDILATKPDLAQDIAGRGAKLNELLKAKRSALSKFNKVRLAYQGPKRPSKQKKVDSNEVMSEKKVDGNEAKAESKQDERIDAEPKEESEKPFVPTASQQQFAAAEKARDKAVEAYESGLDKLISKTDPIAFDRNFNAIYFFRHDPSMLHVEQLKQSSIPSEIKGLGPDMIPFSSWHAIDTKPLYEQFLASLDDRGQREDDLLQACSTLTILKRRLLDDKKESTRSLARERETDKLERRLENARSACDADDGRRSGRLAGVARSELKNLEEEIRQLAKSHKEEERQEKLEREKASDYVLLTGLQMVVDLFAGHRATRSNKKSQNDDDQSEAALLAKIPSHKLWMDERVGGNGTLHILAESLCALEEKCNLLSPWTREDITRNAWRKRLSDASCAWAIDCMLQLGPSTEIAQHDQDSNEGQPALSTPNKKQKVEVASGTSFANIIATFKLSLKDLELRVFEISGKKRSIEEVDTAAQSEDASSDEDDDEELKKSRTCWMIKINALRRLPTVRYGLIRDIIIAAITVARKSHLNKVAAELKAALQLYRPGAASEAKAAAIQVLENHGGYDGIDDNEEILDFDELATANAGEANPNDEAVGAEMASMLCDEVRMISGSIGGDDFADKSDWNSSIKVCKSVSRLAVMLQSFLFKADDILEQMKEERDNLDSILGLNAKRTSRTKSIIKKHDSSTAIWCNVKLTDKLVKARVKGFPWWPARVCTPLESVVADALAGSRYTLVASVGNPSMFMVSEKELVDFTEETDEDLSQYDKSTIDELQESNSIAKKLWRLQNCGVQSPWSKKSRPRIIEEKKTAH